jgi:methionyl-tRNA formyltransferase
VTQPASGTPDVPGAIDAAGTGGPAREPVRTVFLGSGRFGQPTLGRLAAHASIDLVAVVTAPPRPVGRQALVTPTPIEIQARELGLHVQTPERLRDPAAIADVLGLDPDLVVLADYGQIVPAELLDRRFGALNLHPSLLPRHRGATPIPSTILSGDTQAGVTLIEMDAGLDTGPIIAAESWPLDGTETASELEARAAGVGAGLLAKLVGPWLRGELETTPQDETQATMTRPLRREDGRMDVWLTAAELERQVRAYQPWPGSFLDTPGGRLVVSAATVEGPTFDTMPGMVWPGPELRIATAENWLRLDEVQSPGGRRMPGDAWLRGRPSVAGSVIG